MDFIFSLLRAGIQGPPGLGTDRFVLVQDFKIFLGHGPVRSKISIFLDQSIWVLGSLAWSIPYNLKIIIDCVAFIFVFQRHKTMIDYKFSIEFAMTKRMSHTV